MTDISNNTVFHLPNSEFENFFNFILTNTFEIQEDEHMSGNESNEEEEDFNFPNFLTRTAHLSFNADKPKYKHVLSVKGKEQIKFVKYTSEQFKENSICPIVQEEFKEGDNIILLPCKHIFNPDAIMEWLEKENANCPVCRYKLDSIEKLKNPDVPLSPATLLVPPITNLLNYMEQLEEEREGEDIQRAILASLRDISNNSLND